MALLIALYDPDRNSRQTALQQVCADFPAPQGQAWHVIQQLGTCSVSVAYLTPTGTPFDFVADDQGVVFRLGYSFKFDQTDVESLPELLLHVRQDPTSLAGRDGYYLAGRIDLDGKTWLGTDQLALFPLYNCCAGERWGFATAPGLLASVPWCGRSISSVGLAGILLAGYQSGREGLWKGIEAPPPFALTYLRPSKAAEYIPRQPCEAQLESDPEICTDIMGRALELGVQQNLSTSPQGLAFSLSGGLDSRMLAGVLKASSVASVRAFTLGRASDYEAQAAHAVARASNWKFNRVEPTLEQSVSDAVRHARLGCASISLLSTEWWEVSRQSRLWDSSVISGLVGDVTAGGSMADWGWQEGAIAPQFDNAFAKIRSSGLPREAIVTLLGQEGAERIVDEAIDQVRAIWEGLPGATDWRGCYFGLNTRVRFHARPVAWIYACGGGTMLPYAAGPVVRAMHRIDPKIMMGRELQKRWVIQHYPKLARIPVDRNTHDNTPLVPTLAWRIRDRLRPWRLRMLEQRLGLERRYYHRVMHLDSKPWCAIRQLADQSRGGVLDARAIRRLLPSPTSPYPMPADAFSGTMGARTLVQLLLIDGCSI